MTARQTWLSRRAIGLHVVILVILPTFGALCDWQVHRALSGNELSWAYVFEWPFFAGYAVYMWWRILHEEPRPTTVTGPADVAPPAGRTPADTVRPPAAATSGATPDATVDDEVEAERAAYNRYLAELATRGRRKQWR